MPPPDPLVDETERDTVARRAIMAELLPQGPRPLVRPSSRSAMFGPLAVLLAILPGLYGLTHWDLTPPGPWWGLRGLAVLDDGLWVDQSPMAESISGTVDYNALRSTTLQPPLFAWAEAILLGLSPSRSPLATVLPSYMGGVMLILMVYLQGRTWCRPGAAIIATWVFAFHIRTLDAMQRAGPATLATAALIGAIQFYSLHIQAGERGRIRGRILYSMGCGACLGLSLMSVGLIGLVIIPVIGLHQVALNAGESPLERPRHWYEAWRAAPGLFYGATAFMVALVIAAPWHVWMTLVHGSEFLMVLLEPSRAIGPLNRGPAGHLLEAAPVMLALALYGAWLCVRDAVAVAPEPKREEEELTQAAWRETTFNEETDRRQSGVLLWTIWAFVTLGLSVYWPLGPQNSLNLTLAAALSLLAGQTMQAISQRRVSSRVLIWLTPLIILGLTWWGSDQVRAWVRSIQQLDWQGIQSSHNLSQILGLACALFLARTAAQAAWQWGRQSDYRARGMLLGYLSFLLLLQTALGINELRFRHLITRQLLDLRESITRRNSLSPIQHIHVVGTISPEALAALRPELLDPPPKATIKLPGMRRSATGIDPAGRLRFILHSALPRVPQTDHETIESLFQAPAGQRLVIFVGPENRLSIADQSRLALEPIHPGVAKILTAFATSRSASTTAQLPPQTWPEPTKPLGATQRPSPSRPAQLPARLIDHR